MLNAATTTCAGGVYGRLQLTRQGAVSHSRLAATTGRGDDIVSGLFLFCGTNMCLYVPRSFSGGV